MKKSVSISGNPPLRASKDAEGSKDKMTPKRLNQIPEHYIVVRRSRFQLELFKRVGNEYARVYKCPIAIGAVGHTTPGGPAMVIHKESPPTYTAPNEPWAIKAGYTPGQKLAPEDPKNPLRGAFLWLTNDGIGIHGTPNLLSLKSRASHGCVRVRPDDAIKLYETVEPGTPVFIV